ncbi:YceI family protein [Mycobacterium sp. NPDC003323]
MRKAAAIVAGVLGLLLVIAVAVAPWAYKTQVQGPPDPVLTLAAGAAPATTGVDGSWTVQPGSQVGYRVQQQLLWEMVDVNGRTSAVTGGVEIAESHVRSIEISVDVASMQSGSPGRDDKFRSTDALETATFPTAELTSNVPLDLSGIADDGSPVRLEVPVQLTIKGVTRPALAQVDVRRNGDRVDVAGTVPIRFLDFNVDPPKPFASLLQVQPIATIEFLVHLAKG